MSFFSPLLSATAEHCESWSITFLSFAQVRLICNADRKWRRFPLSSGWLQSDKRGLFDAINRLQENRKNVTIIVEVLEELAKYSRKVSKLAKSHCLLVVPTLVKHFIIYQRVGLVTLKLSNIHKRCLCSWNRIGPETHPWGTPHDATVKTSEIIKIKEPCWRLRCQQNQNSRWTSQVLQLSWCHRIDGAEGNFPETKLRLINNPVIRSQVHQYTQDLSEYLDEVWKSDARSDPLGPIKQLVPFSEPGTS